MRNSLRRLLRELKPPRTPGVLAPEYGASVSIELPLASIADLAARASRSRH
jgi:hypothetical protein